MDRTQAKSAPPRLKSKFVKNRTNAMKEIQAWVRKDEEFSVPEASRMSGQLSDNVTEERMLKAKLWELSKERYKFLSQNSYEKKVFQDRQQKKANNRRVVSASADGRSRHASDEAARRERRSSVGDVPQKPAKVRNARLALLDRLDPTNKKRGRGKRPSQDDSTTGKADGGGGAGGRHTPARQFSRANSSTSVLKHQDSKMSMKQMGMTHKDSSTAITPMLNAGVRSRTPAAERKPMADLSENPSQIGSLSSNNNNNNNSKRPGLSAMKSNPFAKTSPSPLATADTSVPDPSSTSASASVQQQQQPSRPTTAGVQCSSWSQTVSGKCARKYGMRIESKVTDPRYAGLEKRLSPLIGSNTTSDVSSIVSTIESLHVRPKRRPIDVNRSRTKIEVKALEFIKEKGFVF